MLQKWLATVAIIAIHVLLHPSCNGFQARLKTCVFPLPGMLAASLVTDFA